MQMCYHETLLDWVFCGYSKDPCFIQALLTAVADEGDYRDWGIVNYLMSLTCVYLSDMVGHRLASSPPTTDWEEAQWNI